MLLVFFGFGAINILAIDALFSVLTRRGMCSALQGRGRDVGDLSCRDVA